MTEIGELSAMNTIDESFENKCPFCYEAPHHFSAKKQEPDLNNVRSIPRNLGCNAIGGEAPGKYARARHHIIPVEQCFMMVRRLARMALSAGYDINSRPNGIPLPTVYNKYDKASTIYGGNGQAGDKQNFGDLDEYDKTLIRNHWMRTLGKQWHVGNHHYESPAKEDSTEDMEDEGEIDHLPYDMEVIKRLIEIMTDMAEANLCKDGETTSDDIKAKLDEISDVEIRNKLDAFNQDPSLSSPFYVSRAALDYRREATIKP